MSIFPAVRPAVTPAVRGAFEQSYGGGSVALIKSLFAAGQQGFWLPFTDFASLSQDSAGTLPYTALEQPVGRVLDRSGRGNHASQPTSTARGVVSARVNLLVNSELISAAPWSTASSGAIVAGTDVAFSAVGQYVSQGVSTAAPVGSAFLGMAVLSGVGKVNLNIVRLFGGGSYEGVLSGDITLTTTPTAYYLPYTIQNSGQIGVTLAVFSNSAAPVASATVHKTSLVPSTKASLPYQRVNTPTDYDAVGFPKSLSVQVDDFYTCGGGGSTTGFYYSDVIRPMGGAGTRRVIWSDRSGNNGYELAINASDKLEFSAGNGTAITTVASTVSATVAEGKRYEVMDDGTNLSVQIDGSAAVTVARPVVTAGSSTITLYRGASTGYFNGQITEPIYRAGPPPSASERATIMGYQKQKAGL